MLKLKYTFIDMVPLDISSPTQILIASYYLHILTILYLLQICC